MATQPTIRAFLRDLEVVLQTARHDIGMKLVKGQIASMDQYNRAVGRAEGLESAIATALDMLGKRESAMDDDDLPTMSGQS